MKRIADIVKRGESETVEFKASFGKDVIATAVAFANTRGGMVLIGVSDAGVVVGSDFRKEALRDYVNRIAVATEPSIIPDAEKFSTPDGTVLVLSVTEFPLKPVATRGRCYRRSGSNTRQMTPSEIAEMHLHSTGQSMDAMIVPGRTVTDIDLDAVRKYMRRATEQGRRSFSDTDDPFDPEHTSKPRNKLVAQMFYDMGLIERYGSGIHRILEACQEADLPEPLFENFSGGFRIKFMLSVQGSQQVAQEAGALNEGINALLEQIKNTTGQRVPQFETALNTPAKTIERWIAVLREMGVIEYRGSKKTGGYWPLS